jgi:hypothetical protein
LYTISAAMETPPVAMELVKRRIRRILMARRIFGARGGFGSLDSCCRSERASAAGSVGPGRSGEVSVDADIPVERGGLRSRGRFVRGQTE